MFPRPSQAGDTKKWEFDHYINLSAVADSDPADATPAPRASPTSLLADPLASLLPSSAAPSPGPPAAIASVSTSSNPTSHSLAMQLYSDTPLPGPPGTVHPPTVPPAAASTTPSPAASVMSPEALARAAAFMNVHLSGVNSAVPAVADSSTNSTPVGAAPNSTYSLPMQFVPGVPSLGSPAAAQPSTMSVPYGAIFPHNGSPAAASTPSPAASAVSPDALVAAMLASAQLTASGAGSPFSPFSSPPPQTLPVGANGLVLPLYQLMQALEQAQAMATQLAVGGIASAIPAMTPPPRTLKYAVVTSATLMADTTLTDARNANGPFVCGESSPHAWTVSMQDPQEGKPSSMCELYLHVLLEGAGNQPLVPMPDTVVRMHVKIEIESLKRSDMPMETVYDDYRVFTAQPVVELYVQFTRVLAKAEKQREIRLKITITPAGGESMVVAGLPSTITCQSRRTADRKAKAAADESSTPTSSSSSSAPAPPTPSPTSHATKKRSVGQRGAASTDSLAAIPDDQVEDVRQLIVNGGAVAKIGKILRNCKVPYEVRRDLLETVLRVHLVTNPHGQRGPWSAAEFKKVVALLNFLPGKPVWTGTYQHNMHHNLVHDVARRCFDRDQLRVIFHPLLPTTSTSSTATPARSAATALRLALVTPDKDGRTPAHVAAYCVNVEFLVLVGQVYPMALAQLNAMTKASFLHSLAGRDGAVNALQRLRDELPPWLIEQAVTAVDTYGCTPLAMAEYQAKVRKRDEVWPTVEMLSEMVAAMQVA